MLRTVVATCLLRGASVVGGEYQDGYAEYDEHPFSLPCGTRHTGSDTSVRHNLLQFSGKVTKDICCSVLYSSELQEVSEWRRVRPDFEEVSGRLYNYKVCRAPCR